MEIREFDFPLPEALIALRPAQKRDESRLAVLRGSRLEHRRFRDLPEYLSKGDLLIINNTKVLPVRLTGEKPTGGKLEVLLARNLSGDTWEVLSKGGYTGSLRVSEHLSLELTGGGKARLLYEGDLKKILYDSGDMPLPPYIKRKPDGLDKERYQTVYARKEGSIAAPTAGLHFTPGLLDRLREKGVLVRELTLHVGRGTFAPIRADNLEDHRMEEEYFELDRTLPEEIEKTKKSGGRVFTVGTTATRAVEGYLSGNCGLLSSPNGRIMGTTGIFIYPGYNFRAADCLITNFHLPRSTPLMLASALCGRENLLGAYKECVNEGYRFFSYGDAMLILDR